MSTAVWIVIAIVIILACAGGGKKTAQKGPYRIDRPHVIDPDDFECSVRHRRFQEEAEECPYCGAQFVGRVTDEGEWYEEEDELEAWDEEDDM